MLKNSVSSNVQLPGKLKKLYYSCLW